MKVHIKRFGVGAAILLVALAPLGAMFVNPWLGVALGALLLAYYIGFLIDLL